MANQIVWMRWLPGLLTLRRYQANWLAHDIIAGIVLVTMLVPVGIAYAVAWACRALMVSTRRSSRCWLMRCSAPVGFWFSDRTHHWRRSSSASSFRYPAQTLIALLPSPP